MATPSSARLGTAVPAADRAVAGAWAGLIQVAACGLETKVQQGLQSVIGDAELAVIPETAELAAYDVLVIGAGVRDAVALAQRMHRANRHARVLLTAAGKEVTQLRSALLTAPNIGKGTTVVSLDEPTALESNLRTAINGASARRVFGQRMAAVREDLGKISPTQGPQAPRILGRLLDAIPIGVVVLDPAGTVLTWNRMASRFLGIQDRDAQGMRFGTLLAGDARYQLTHGLTQAKLAPEGSTVATWTMDVASVDRTRTLRLDCTASPIELEEQQYGLLVLLKDATHQRQMQHLRIQKDTAEAASRVKGEFLANMSHEIRTPLNAVIGLAALLQDTPLDAEQERFIDTIQQAGQHLLGLVNDILDFSKIEAGKLEIELEPTALTGLLDQVFDVVAPAAHAKGIELICAVDEDCPPAFHVDPSRLRQILINLVSNAVKFTESGEVVVRVHATPLATANENGSSEDDVATEPAAIHSKPQLPTQKAQGAAKGKPAGPETSAATDAPAKAAVHMEIAFEIQDTGPGIGPETRRNLFEPFTQADASSTRRYGGTGLGLAISKRLVDLLDGQITLRSELGKGSTFVVQIPVLVAGTTMPVPDVDAAIFRGKHVLVVDDNATNVEILSYQLEHLGLQVTAYQDPAQALAALTDAQPGTFDVAVIDQNMPDLDGLALAEKSYAALGEAAPPFVLLTSTLLLRNAVAHCSAQIAGRATKPTQPDHLAGLVAGALRTETLPGPQHASAKTVFEHDLAQRHPCTILVVEDNDVNQMVLERVLQRFGYAPMLAANGREALEKLADNPCDIVFMDIQMPELDGLEATRRIRAAGDPATPWIIAMTAHAALEDRRRCLDAGMNDYLGKPVTPGAIRSAIVRAAKTIERTQASAAGGAQPAESPRTHVARRASDGAASRPHAVAETIPAPALDPANLAQLRELGQSDPTFLSDLRRLFLADAEGQFATVQTAIETGDGDGIAKAAHKLAGGCRTIAASDLATRLRDIESAARDGDIARVRALFEGIPEAFSRACDAVREEFPEA